MNLITGKNTLSDFDKLLFAQGYIQELKNLLSSAEIKIGILESDIAELTEALKPKGLHKIRDYKKKIEQLQEVNKKLRKEQESMLQQLIKLKNGT